jgi:hypothetical protein
VQYWEEWPQSTIMTSTTNVIQLVMPMINIKAFRASQLVAASVMAHLTIHQMWVL